MQKPNYTDQTGASINNIKNLYVTQNGSANGGGNMTATSPDVNWLNITDGTNAIASLINFTTVPYNDITIIPTLACVGGGVTILSTMNVHLANGAASIFLDAPSRESVILRYDADLSASLGSPQYVQVNGKVRAPQFSYYEYTFKINGQDQADLVNTTQNFPFYEGSMYQITNYVVGIGPDDFSNVAASVVSGNMNTTGCIFIANNVGNAASWSDGSTITQLTPWMTVKVNTMPNTVSWAMDVAPNPYEMRLTCVGAFANADDVYLAPQGQGDDNGVTPVLYPYRLSNDVIGFQLLSVGANCPFTLKVYY